MVVFLTGSHLSIIHLHFVVACEWEGRNKKNAIMRDITMELRLDVYLSFAHRLQQLISGSIREARFELTKIQDRRKTEVQKPLNIEYIPVLLKFSLE